MTVVALVAAAAGLLWVGFSVVTALVVARAIRTAERHEHRVRRRTAQSVR